MIAAPFARRAAIRSRGGWILFIAGWAVLGLVVVAIAWIVVTGLLARSHLNQVRAELPKLRSALSSGDMAKAHALARDITSHARSAHDLSTGPAWWVASNVPILGTPLQTSRTIAAQADRVGKDVLPGVLTLADDVSTMHVSNSTIDLNQIANAAPTLQSAARAAHEASQAVAGSSSSWLGYVSSARNSVGSALRTLDGELSGADRATQVLLPMLGQSGEQRYMIGFQNEAESRGLGGIPGAFAIVTADHGKITFTHFGSDDELHGVRADVNLGAEFNARYAQDDPTGVIQNSDLSPDFRDAAQIWAGMWQKKSGQHLDGALAIDPTALSYLLKVTGAATLPDGSQVGAQDVVALTQQGQYARYGSSTAHDKAERKQFLTTLAKAISTRITKGGHGTQLVRALSKSASERRLVVWSANPGTEKLIVAGGWGGVLDAAGAPFTGFVVNNAAGSKLDYYLDRTMTYHRTGCGANSTAVATFTLTNSAPAKGLPPYVTTRADGAPKGARPGDNHLLVTYYGSVGAVLKSVDINGKPMTLASGTENGLLAVTADLELPVGKSATISVTLTEPAADDPVQILRQPLVRPMETYVDGDHCG